MTTPKSPTLAAPICTLLLALAMALSLSACASTQGGDQDTALLECRSEADAKYKARYTPKWEDYVEQCLEKKQQK